ncbi:uncharacterized protein PG998_009557 [Apiospora kogelbergensis]|uniref:uncharacterized protein n=1 Tax=Apiospora kogelbergensis TaxID=1337665 RepID=UPI003130DBFF
MKWWWTASQTTCAWSMLVKTLGLSHSLTAIFLAAPDVRQALQAYDEHYLQPLLATRAAARAMPLVPKPSSQELVAKVLPVGRSAYHEPEVRALWEDYFDEAARRTQERSHYRGSNHYLHASIASWRMLKWLQTEEAAELGLVDFCAELMPYNWGAAVSVVEVLLKYLYDFAGELQVSTTSTEEESGK